MRKKNNVDKFLSILYILEFNTITEAIPTEKWRSIGDFPLFDQTIAIIIWSGPQPLLNICGSVVFWEMFISSQVNVITLLFRPEVHFEPEFFQWFIIVRPPGLKVFEPRLIQIEFVSLV